MLTQNLQTMNMKKYYSNGEITVVWQPRLCVHSGTCLNGLPSVFNNAKSPWIDMNGATTAEIIKQVDACPSGALKWHRNEEFYPG